MLKDRAYVGFGLISIGLVVLSIPMLVAIYYVSYSRHLPYQLTPSELGFKYTEHRIINKFGTYLNAWFVPRSQPESSILKPGPAIIITHGHHSNMGTIDHPSYLRDVCLAFHKKGYSCLLYDLSNHGSSEDRYPVSLGYYEKFDFVAVLEWLRSNSQDLSIHPDQITAFGASMGGAITLLGAEFWAKEFGSQGINSLVIDSSYNDFFEPVILRLQKSWLPSIVHPFIIESFPFLLGVSAKSLGVLNNLEHLKAPILFIHSKYDETTPYTASVEIYEGMKKRAPQFEHQLWLTEAEGHLLSVAKDYNLYEKTITDFVIKHSKKI